MNGVTKPIGVATYDLPPEVKEAHSRDEIKQHLVDMNVEKKSRKKGIHLRSETLTADNFDLENEIAVKFNKMIRISVAEKEYLDD